MIRVKEDSASTLAQANLNLKNFEAKYNDLEYLQMEGPLKRLYAWSCVSNNKRAFDVCERICGKWKKNAALLPLLLHINETWYKAC